MRARWRKEVGPGSVHLGLWRLPDGERRWAIAAPYDPKLVEGIKRIPGRCRAWLPGVKVWMFEREYAPAIRELCERLFWTETLCAVCWEGVACAELAEAADRAKAVVLSTKPPAPSPPWPPEVPKSPIAAARILGLTLGASADEVKRRARQLSFEAHPDRGGTDDAVRVILGARDLVLGVVKA